MSFLIGVQEKKKSPWLIVSFILFLLVALLRPYWGSKEITIEGKGANILLLLDVSRSMAATDVLPSRFELAKRKALDIVQFAQKNSPNSKIGIMLFAGSPYLFCPSTSDYAVLKTYLQSIPRQSIQEPGSDLVSALHEASTALGEGEGAVVLLSDGEDISFDIKQLLSALRGDIRPIFSLGFGTENGSPIAVGGAGFLRNREGEVVVSKLHSETLRLISEKTGGAYFLGTTGDDDIQRIFSSQQSFPSKVTQKNELGFMLVFIAGIIFIYGSYSRAILCFCLVLSCSIFLSGYAFADASDEAVTGAEAYHKKEFIEATKKFTEAHERQPNDFKILQSLGSSQFKSNDFANAAQSFRKLSSLAHTKEEQYISHYNLGNTLLSKEDLEEAIKEYDAALAAKPHDVKAETNKKIAKERLEKKNQEQNQQPSQQKNDQQNENEKKKDTGQNKNPNDSTVSPTPTENAGDQNSAQEKKNSLDEEKKTGTPKETEKKEEKKDERSLSTSEKTKDGSPQKKEVEAANRWLDSLPDSQLIAPPRKQTHKQSADEQTW